MNNLTDEEITDALIGRTCIGIECGSGSNSGKAMYLSHSRDKHHNGTKLSGKCWGYVTEFYKAELSKTKLEELVVIFTEEIKRIEAIENEYEFDHTGTENGK